MISRDARRSVGAITLRGISPDGTDVDHSITELDEGSPSDRE